MFTADFRIEDFPTPQNRYERLELARHLFHLFRPLCFWHAPRDLEINEERIPFVMNGLCANGGRLGFRLAARLQQDACERELPGCP